MVLPNHFELNDWMFASLGNFVSRRWLLVILFWIVLCAVLRATAPKWEDVTYDGDFAYLPERMPSVVGERLLNEAFPKERAKSQFVIVVAREDRALANGDLLVAQDLARRVLNLHAASILVKLQRVGDAEVRDPEEASRVAQLALDTLKEAALLDEHLADFNKSEEAKSRTEVPRLAAIYWNLATVYDALENFAESKKNYDLAVAFDPEIATRQGKDTSAEDNLPLVDVWTWRDDIFGRKLVSDDGHARLIVLQLRNEFMAVDNIRVAERIEREMNAVRAYAGRLAEPGLEIAMSGSAAVGADMLRSSADSIRNTELVTVILIVGILAIVYRSPILVFIPLVTIGVAFVASISLIALLTQLNLVTGFGWWDLKVFTTTKIFIVVILFGAGTDYCLFLISRYREELQAGNSAERAVAISLASVGEALAASALTTIVGIGMMFFADFGKFHYSGPVIGMALTLTLLASVTLAPALLRASGRWVFWPGKIAAAVSLEGHENNRPLQRAWQRLADAILRRPGLILIGSVALMLPAAFFGWRQETHVTYDVLSALAPQQPSKIGARILQRHYPVGESGPITVIARKPNAQFTTKDGRRQIDALSAELYIDGVTGVRCITDPLGVVSPDDSLGLFRGRDWLTRFSRAHPRTEAIFVATQGALAGNVTRLEVVIEHDPFSEDAMRVLENVEQRLAAIQQGIDTSDEADRLKRRAEFKRLTEFWEDADFSYAGIGANIRDLRSVTRSDHTRIQILVVISVFLVLLFILKHPLVCAYMILSVLFSYYVTLGITLGFFAMVYGESFQGLDWKVPLFLFVILVAIGQDYNVYLATRVFEEQQRLGDHAGLRRAIITTGGIITSCGVIMAGTFFSMTSGSWLGILSPGSSSGALRGIVELGFALSLGVLLDTFIIRTILVPAILAITIHKDAPAGVENKSSG